MSRRASAGALVAGLAASIALLSAGRAGAAAADDEPGAGTPGGGPRAASNPVPAARRGRIELRRQNSERGTTDESTRTTVRLETYLDGPVSRLRLDLLFPDEKTDFAGDPFNPRPGDVKVRASSRAFRFRDAKLASDVELIFPTADPPELGAGKYQVSAAIHGLPDGPALVSASGRHRLQVEWSLRHNVSVAGDPQRKDINWTKPELALRDLIDSRYWLKLTFKPVIDWVRDGRTGALLELEAGWNAGLDWRLSVMGGAGLWGENSPGWYHRRLELVVGRAY